MDSSKPVNSSSSITPSPQGSKPQPSQIAKITTTAFHVFNTVLSPFYWIAKNPGRTLAGIASVRLFSTLRDSSLRQIFKLAIATLLAQYALFPGEDDLPKTKEAVMEAISKDATILKRVDKKFLDDKDIMLLAIKCDCFKTFSLSSSRLKEDLAFVLEAGLLDPVIINFISKEMKDKILVYLETNTFSGEKQDAVTLLKNTLTNALRPTLTEADLQRPPSPPKKKKVTLLE